MAAPGDRVLVVSKDGEYEGILMPRPEILEKGITVVKLDNGYNIGVEEKKIKEIKVLEKYKEKKKTAAKLSVNPKLPTVALLSFGGTIASRVEYETGGVRADYDASDYVQMIPELGKIANIKAENVMEIMSEDVTPSDWVKMAKETVKHLKDVDGVIITQGTDTLHYSSAALSFLLHSIGKPVVFTAAQRSIDRGSSDAFMNLLCAVRAAAELKKKGVWVCLHGTTNDDYCLLIPGTKVRKMHTSRRDAFRPINTSNVVKIYPDKKIEGSGVASEGKNVVDGGFEPVGFIKTYPGMDTGVVDYHIKKGVKGLVIEATGLGNVPQDLVGALEKVKIPKVICSQTIYGRVHPYVYTNLRELSLKLGCIFAEDMPPETAYVKLMWALKKDPKKAKSLMLTNIAGEISERTGMEFLS